jgi:hypothetical protein
MASIICGNCKQIHASVAEVAECYAETEYNIAEARAEAYAESAWLRAAESAGAGEAELERRIEIERGVLSFSDAYDLACPERANR